ncbi:MAG: hypothetical protein R3F55_24755 [Alphaproteobacteria bacterium]
MFASAIQTVSTFFSAVAVVAALAGTGEARAQAPQVAVAVPSDQATMMLPGGTFANEPGDATVTASAPLVAPSCPAGDEAACTRLAGICTALDGTLAAHADGSATCFLQFD